MSLQQKNKTMKKEKARIYYDESGDLLEVYIGKPAEGYYEDLGDDIFVRRDEKTGETRGFKIFSFKKRVTHLKFQDIPIEEPPLSL